MSSFWFGFPNWVKPQLDRIEFKLDGIDERIFRMDQKVSDIKQGLDDAMSTLNQMGSTLDAVALDLQTLKDEVATGGNVSQADLDDILAKVQAVKQSGAATLSRVHGMDDPNIPPVTP